MVVPSPIQLSLGWQLKFPSYDIANFCTFSQQESCSCTGHFTFLWWHCRTKDWVRTDLEHSEFTQMLM